jgi:hypothetical protein
MLFPNFSEIFFDQKNPKKKSTGNLSIEKAANLTFHELFGNTLSIVPVLPDNFFLIHTTRTYMEHPLSKKMFPFDIYEYLRKLS